MKINCIVSEHKDMSDMRRPAVQDKQKECFMKKKNCEDDIVSDQYKCRKCMCILKFMQQLHLFPSSYHRTCENPNISL